MRLLLSGAPSVRSLPRELPNLSRPIVCAGGRIESRQRVTTRRNDPSDAYAGLFGEPQSRGWYPHRGATAAVRGSCQFRPDSLRRQMMQVSEAWLGGPSPERLRIANTI